MVKIRKEEYTDHIESQNSVYAYEPYGTVSTNPSAAINISQEAVTEAGTLSDHVTSTQKQKAEDRFIVRGTH